MMVIVQCADIARCSCLFLTTTFTHRHQRARSMIAFSASVSDKALNSHHPMKICLVIYCNLSRYGAVLQS